MTEHAVVIAGGGPTGLMLAGELALAGVDVAIVERRASQDLPGSRAGGLHSRTIEVLDQRGIADRFLSQGQVAQVAGFAGIPLDISDFPTRHNYGLGLWQNHIERILAGWVGELTVPIYRGREVTGFAQDHTRVDVGLSDGRSLRAEYLVGCDGGRTRIRKAAGIEFPGWDPTTSSLIAEVEMAEEVSVDLDCRLLPGFRPDDVFAELSALAGVQLEFDVVRDDPGLPAPDLTLFETLGAILRELDPEARPAPLLLPGVTDGRFFARLGIQTYGFLPMQLPPGMRFLELVHGVDERIPVDAVAFGTAAIRRLLERFGKAIP